MGNLISTHFSRPVRILESIPLLGESESVIDTNNDTRKIEKLTKILLRKSIETIGVRAISREMFVGCVFFDQPILGSYIFYYMYVNAKATTPNYLDPVTFREQCKLLVSAFNPADRLMIIAKMFCIKVKKMTPLDLHALLVASYELTTAHYPRIEMSESYRSTVECILQSVIKSCFRNQRSLRIDLACRWIDEHLPHLIPPMFKFTVHRLTTAYRKINATDIVKHSKLYFLRVGDVAYDDVTEIALQTPRLDVVNYQNPQILLCRSRAWLLSCVLPMIYCKPSLRLDDESCENGLKNRDEMTKEIFERKITAALPSDWAILYDIETNGASVRAFAECVRYYHGASLCLISFKDFDYIEYLFCCATSVQWKEAHLYVGDENCYLIQLLPKFAVLNTGPNLIHLKSVHVYPLGLSFGSDHTNPILSIQGDFHCIIYEGRIYNSPRIVVWRCDDLTSCNIQMDFKKWHAVELKRLAKGMPNRLTI